MTSVLKSEIVALYVIFGDEAEARKVGREMVEARLAACVNILGPCRSIYRWQGTVEEADEVAAIFKTGHAGINDLMQAIHAAHSYDIPAIAVLPIASTHRAYLDWVLENSR